MAASFVSHNGVHCSSTILPNPSPNFTSPSYSNSAHPSKTSIHTSSVKPFLVPPTLLSLFPTLKVNNAQGTQHHLAPLIQMSGTNGYECMLLNGPCLTPPCEGISYTPLEKQHTCDFEGYHRFYSHQFQETRYIPSFA